MMKTKALLLAILGVLLLSAANATHSLRKLSDEKTVAAPAAENKSCETNATTIKTVVVPKHLEEQEEEAECGTVKNLTVIPKITADENCNKTMLPEMKEEAEKCESGKMIPVTHIKTEAKKCDEAEAEAAEEEGEVGLRNVPVTPGKTGHCENAIGGEGKKAEEEGECGCKGKKIPPISEETNEEEEETHEVEKTEGSCKREVKPKTSPKKPGNNYEGYTIPKENAQKALPAKSNEVPQYPATQVGQNCAGATTIGAEVGSGCNEVQAQTPISNVIYAQQAEAPCVNTNSLQIEGITTQSEIPCNEDIARTNQIQAISVQLQQPCEENKLTLVENAEKPCSCQNKQQDMNQNIAIAAIPVQNIEVTTPQTGDCADQGQTAIGIQSGASYPFSVDGNLQQRGSYGQGALSGMLGKYGGLGGVGRHVGVVRQY